MQKKVNIKLANQVSSHIEVVKKLVFSLLLLQSLQMSSQPIDSFYRPAGLIISYESVFPQFYGDHVMSQSITGWSGFNLSLGLSIYDKAEIIVTIGRIEGDLIDRQYIFYGGSAKVRKISFKAPILKWGRLTYLYPDLSLGGTQTSFAGEVNGNSIEIANNLRFDLTNNFKLVARIAYQRTQYNIKTHPDLLSLYDVSNAIIPSIGIQFNTRMLKKKRYRFLKRIQ